VRLLLKILRAWPLAAVLLLVACGGEQVRREDESSRLSPHGLEAPVLGNPRAKLIPEELDESASCARQPCSAE